MQQTQIVPPTVGAIVVASSIELMTTKTVVGLRAHIPETQLPLVFDLLVFLSLTNQLVHFLFLSKSHHFVGVMDCLEGVLFWNDVATLDFIDGLISIQFDEDTVGRGLELTVHIAAHSSIEELALLTSQTNYFEPHSHHARMVFLHGSKLHVDYSTIRQQN